MHRLNGHACGVWEKANVKFWRVLKKVNYSPWIHASSLINCAVNVIIVCVWNNHRTGVDIDLSKPTNKKNNIPFGLSDTTLILKLGQGFQTATE